MNRRTKVLAVTPVAVLAAGGIAWAALGGVVNLPDIASGIATSNGGAGCQSSALNFIVPDPTWDNGQAAYVVTTIDFANVDAVCVNNGTADLELQVVQNGSTLANATATDIGATGTLTLSTPLEYDVTTSADFVYLVKG